MIAYKGIQTRRTCNIEHLYNKNMLSGNTHILFKEKEQKAILIRGYS